MAGAVLVTDGEQRAALAVVRSLGKAGREVHVASSAPRPLAGASRYAHAEYRVPSPLEQPEAFVEAIVALARRVRWVLPITDASMLALTRDPVRLASAALPYPSGNIIRAVADKKLVAERAAAIGLFPPPQVVADRPGIAADPGGFPCYVKPSRSIVTGPRGLTRLTAVPVANEAELDALIARLPAGAWPLLLQRRIEGPGIGIFLLRWQGRTRAFFAHRRLREKPPGGGVSVFRESIEPPPDLLARTERLLDAMSWDGPAMVEYKVDASNGTPYLMEINGRYWGSLQLAIDAGVDFPRLHLALAEGEDVGAVPEYRCGVRSRWELGELDYVLARLRRSKAKLGLPATTPGRLRTVLDVLTPGGRRTRGEILRVDDPLPFVRELAAWIAGRSA